MFLLSLSFDSVQVTTDSIIILNNVIVFYQRFILQTCTDNNHNTVLEQFNIFVYTWLHLKHKGKELQYKNYVREWVCWTSDNPVSSCKSAPASDGSLSLMIVSVLGIHCNHSSREKLSVSDSSSDIAELEQCLGYFLCCGFLLPVWVTLLILSLDHSFTAVSGFQLDWVGASTLMRMSLSNVCSFKQFRRSALINFRVENTLSNHHGKAKE